MLYFTVNHAWSMNQTVQFLKIQGKLPLFKGLLYQSTVGVKKAHQYINKRRDNNNNSVAKIIYNNVIKNVDTFKVPTNSKIQTGAVKPSLVSLKYLKNEFNEEIATSYEEKLDVIKDEKHLFNFPYEKHDNITFSNNDDSVTEKEENNLKHKVDLTFTSIKDKSCKKSSRRWMQDYKKYAEVSVKQVDEDSDDENPAIEQKVQYGSADPNVPSSTIPCGGCGAHIHCQDLAIPGFLPKEIFVGLSNEQLQALVCQRCHFMREYDTALSVSVDPKIYPQLLSKIKEQTALVVLVVDMTDFPCSIWPGILDVIGPKRPLIVVGNKIDLLQDWSRDWLIRAKQALIKQLPRDANVLHVTLVSAKTGFGIEDLITTLYNLWEYRGDVYLVGCTNVGKSTLFNVLLQSDYCKTKAVDLMQRATISPWPGTTLNLLKFPIMRPEGKRLALRTLRLRKQSAEDLIRLQKGKTERTPQMISLIQRTFAHGITDKYNDEYWDDPFSIPKMTTLRRLRTSRSGLDPNDPLFVHSKWLYDTPGVMTPDQIIDLLTTEELMLTLPREPMVPRTFQVWPGQSLLLAGLGRLDYVDGPANLKMTVLSASTLPVTLCWIADANEVYEQYVGTEVLAVPCGGEHRLQVWPGLESAPDFTLKAIGWKESCADVVLSSAGWVAITGQEDTICHLQAWTPKARGIHIRIPPVLPRAIAVKGVRMHKSQAYALYNDRIKAMIK